MRNRIDTQRIARLEAAYTTRRALGPATALALLTDAELTAVSEFAQSWDGDDAHIEAVYAAHPGTREAVARLEVLGQQLGVEWV
jgi:hypothetical protein